MSHYHHLSIAERGRLLVLHTEGKSLHAVAAEIGRSVSTVSRGIKRNSLSGQSYSAIAAHGEYRKRRRKCSRYLLAGKVTKRYSALVADEMIELLSALPKKKRRSITPDRGKEFSKHSIVTKAMNGLQFYFPDPHAPW